MDVLLVEKHEKVHVVRKPRLAIDDRRHASTDGITDARDIQRPNKQQRKLRFGHEGISCELRRPPVRRTIRDGVLGHPQFSAGARSSKAARQFSSGAQGSSAERFRSALGWFVRREALQDLEFQQKVTKRTKRELRRNEFSSFPLFASVHFFISPKQTLRFCQCFIKFPHFLPAAAGIVGSTTAFATHNWRDRLNDFAG